MARKRARILSDSELTALDWELRALLSADGVLPSRLVDLFVRFQPDGDMVFPIDGYESWQHRWFMGTGVRPKGW